MLTQNEIKETLEKILVFKEKNLVGNYKSYLSEFKNSNSTANVYKAIQSLNRLIDYSIFNNYIVKYLKSIDVYDFFGQSGLVKFSSIIAHSSNDRNGVINSIEKFISELEERIRRIEYILETLNVLEPSKEEKYKLESREELLSIHFQNNCNVTGLNELSTAADDWNKILIELNKLSGNEKVEGNNILFSDIRKGSLHIDIPSSVATVALLCKSVSWILDTQNKYLQNKELLQKLKQDTILKDSTRKNMELDYEAHLEEERERIANEVYLKIKADSSFKILDNEQDIAVSKIFINKLNDFIANGGDIDFIFPNEENQESKQLKAIYETMKMQIEYKKNPIYIEKK